MATTQRRPDGTFVPKAFSKASQIGFIRCFQEVRKKAKFPAIQIPKAGFAMRPLDFVCVLNEFLEQKKQQAPYYTFDREEDVWICTVFVDIEHFMNAVGLCSGFTCVATGYGRSKAKAKQFAAKRIRDMILWDNYYYRTIYNSPEAEYQCVVNETERGSIIWLTKPPHEMLDFELVLPILRHEFIRWCGSENELCIQRKAIVEEEVERQSRIGASKIDDEVTTVDGFCSGCTMKTVRPGTAIPTVATENTLGSSYLIKAGYTLDTGDQAGKTVATIQWPQLFFKDRAPEGLASWHRLFRSNLLLTVHMPTTSFHQGMLAIWYDAKLPYGQSPVGKGLEWSTLPLNPHAFFPIGRCTHRTFRIPYSQVFRLLSTGGLTQPEASVGDIKFTVWNVLRTVTSQASNTLHFSVYMQLEDPYLGLRARQVDPFANASSFQLVDTPNNLWESDDWIPLDASASEADMEDVERQSQNVTLASEENPSNVATGQEVAISSHDEERKNTGTSYLKSHTALVNLLNRADLVCRYGMRPRIDTDKTWEYIQCVTGPITLGPTQTCIAQQFGYCSGSIDYTFVSAMSNMTKIVFEIVYDLGVMHDQDMDAKWVAENNYHAVSPQQSLSNIIVWNPQIEPVKRVSFPYYMPTPVMSTQVRRGGEQGKGEVEHPRVAILGKCTVFAHVTYDQVTQQVGETKAQFVPSLISFSIWAHAGEDFKLYFPVLTPVLSVTDPLNQALPAPEATSRGRARREDVERQSAAESNIITDVANTIESIVNPIASGIAGVGNLLGGLGIFDRPHEMDTNVSSICSVGGPIRSTLMGVTTDDLSIESQADVVSRTGPIVDLKEIFKIPCRVFTVSWTTAQADGFVLGSIPISPSTCHVTLEGEGAGRYRKFHATHLGFFSQFYNMWRGGMKVVIEIVASKFHQGQIYICFSPFPNTSTPTLGHAKNLNGVVMDISSEEQRVTFEIPYYHIQDYCATSPYKAGKQYFDHVDVVPQGKEFKFTDRWLTGNFYIFVQNPLVVNSEAISKTVEINGYLAAMDDFEFNVPKKMEQNLKYFVNDTPHDPYNQIATFNFGTVAKTERDAQKDLTEDGDVESNPGPVMSLPISEDTERQGIGDALTTVKDILQALIGGIFGEVVALFADTPAKLFTVLGAPADFVNRKLREVRTRVESALWQELDEQIGGFYDQMMKIVEFLHDFYLIIWISRKFVLALTSNYSLMDLSTDIFMVMTCKVNLVKSIIYHLMDYLKVSRQASTDEETVTVLTGIVSMFLAVMGLGTFDRKSVSSLVSMEVMRGGARVAFNKLPQVFTRMVNWIFDGDSAEVITADKFLDTKKNEIEAWMALFEIYWYEGKFTNKGLVEDDDSYGDPLVFLMKLRNFIVEIKPKVMLSRRYASLSRFIQRFEKLWDEVRKGRAGMRRHMEPVGLLLRGKSGVGKSYLTSTLMPSIVLPDVGLARNRNAAVEKGTYSMPNDPNQAYYDNYAEQPWAIYDDLGASVEGKDWLKMINLISTADAPLNMAKLDEKGQIFISSFVTASSNKIHIQDVQSITNTGAIVRRFPFSYSVTMQAGKYSIGTGDEAKLDMEQLVADVNQAADYDAEMAIYDKVWNFRKWNMVRGHVGDEVITLSKLCDDMAKHYIKKRKTNARIKFTNEKCKNTKLADFMCQFVADPDLNPISLQMQERLGVDFDPYADMPELEDGDTDRQAGSIFEKFKPKQVRQYLIDCRSVDGSHDRLREIITMLYNDLKQLEDKEWDKMLDIVKQIPMRHYASLTKFMLWCCKQDEETCRLAFMACIWRCTASWILSKQWAGFSALGIVMVSPGSGAVTLGGFGPHPEHMAVLNVAERETYDKFLSKWQYSYDCTVGTSAVWYGLKNAQAWFVTRQGLFGDIINLMYALGMGYMFGVLLRKVFTAVTDWLFSVDREAYSTPTRHFGARGERQSATLDKKLVTNVVQVYASGQVISHAIFVDQWHVLMNAHTLNDNKGKIYLQLKDREGNPLNRIVVPRDTVIPVKPHNDWECSRDEILDLVLIRLGSPVNGIRKFRNFMTRKEAKVELDNRDRIMTFCGSLGGGDDVPAVVKGYSLYFDSTELFLKCVLETPTEKGMCGLPYITKNGKIVGLHGLYDRGESNRSLTYVVGLVPVFVEDVTQALVYATVKYGKIRHVTSEFLEGDKEKPEDFRQDVEVQGKVCIEGEPLKSPIMTKSTFVPSPLAIENDDGHLPSRMNRSVMEKQVQRYGYVYPAHDPITHEEKQFVKKVYGWIFEQFPNRYQEILDENQVLNGVPEKHIGPVVLNTSAGIWSEANGGVTKKKHDIIEMGEDGVRKFTEAAHERVHRILGRSFYDYYQQRREKAKELTRMVDSVVITTLKDELLPTSKVEKKGARTFEIPPLDSTLLMREYLGSFGGWYRSHSGPILCHGIGQDKESVWREYHELLTTGGSMGIKADFHQFDASITPEDIVLVSEIIELFYSKATEEERNVRAVIFHELQITQHLAGEMLFISTKGLISGSWLTDVINSIVNVNCWMILYRRLFIEAYGYSPGVREFYEDMTLFTYGDDVVLTVSANARRFLTPQKIQEVMYALGKHITDADKDSLPEYVPVTELTFLKSKFNKLDEIDPVVLPEMPKEIVYRELNWCKTHAADDVLLLSMRAEDALRMASYVSEEFYNQIAEHIRNRTNYIPALRLQPLFIPPWREWRSEFWQKQSLMRYRNVFVRARASDLARKGGDFFELPEWRKQYYY